MHWSVPIEKLDKAEMWMKWRRQKENILIIKLQVLYTKSFDKELSND